MRLDSILAEPLQIQAVLARLNVPVSLVGRIGNDPLGILVRQQIEKWIYSNGKPGAAFKHQSQKVVSRRRPWFSRISLSQVQTNRTKQIGFCEPRSGKFRLCRR
jgi:hypothetical protein